MSLFEGPVYQGPDPLGLGGDNSVGDTVGDVFTGDDPNDDVDMGQWVNKVIPGTPLAAAEEFGGPQEPETWEEDDDNPWDVTQEESTNTVDEWANNVTTDVTGLSYKPLLGIVGAVVVLYLIRPLLEVAAGASA